MPGTVLQTAGLMAQNTYLNDEYRDSDPYNWGRVAVDFGFQSIVATLKRRCVKDVL